MSAPLLRVSQLHVAYGGIRAVKGISLEVYPGELVCLIGANGAGKSTTLKAITGLEPVAGGAIEFKGQRIAAPGTGHGAWQLVSQGLVMVPEGRGTFTRMSIEENLLMGAFVRMGERHTAPVVADDLARVYALFPRLKERRKQLAGTLSGGEQQMLALGRALMAKPELLLLDEPSMGLAPLMVDKVFEVIEGIATQGVTVLLVEQNASRALHLAQRGYVMESGEISMAGEAQALLADERVRAAYLGE